MDFGSVVLRVLPLLVAACAGPAQQSGSAPVAAAGLASGSALVPPSNVPSPRLPRDLASTVGVSVSATGSSARGQPASPPVCRARASGSVALSGPARGLLRAGGNSREIRTPKSATDCDSLAPLWADGDRWFGFQDGDVLRFFDARRQHGLDEDVRIEAAAPANVRPAPDLPMVVVNHFVEGKGPEARLWSLAPPKRIRTLPGSASWLPGGIIEADDVDDVTFIDVRAGTQRRFSGHAVAESASGHTIVVGSLDGRLFRAIDPATGRETGRIAAEGGDIAEYHVYVRENPTLIAWVRGAAVVAQRPDGRVVSSGASAVNVGCASPDSEWIAGAGVLVNWTTGVVHRPPVGTWTFCGWSADSRDLFVATASDSFGVFRSGLPVVSVVWRGARHAFRGDKLLLERDAIECAVDGSGVRCSVHFVDGGVAMVGDDRNVVGLSRAELSSALDLLPSSFSRDPDDYTGFD